MRDYKDLVDSEGRTANIIIIDNDANCDSDDFGGFKTIGAAVGSFRRQLKNPQSFLCDLRTIETIFIRTPYTTGYGSVRVYAKGRTKEAPKLTEQDFSDMFGS